MKGLSPLGLSPKGTVPSRKSQRGYLLITVVVALFLIATVAVLLTQESAISANTANKELETARADYVAQAGMQHALWRAGNNACMGDVSIPATTLGTDSYTATISGAAAGTSYVLNADQDAWIRNDDPDKNNGTTDSNHIRFETGNTEQVLTRFDLSALPANAQINSAIARFHLKASKTHPEGPIAVHEIAADWQETKVTWDSFGGAYQAAKLGTLPAQDTGGVWVAINLTGQVQAWVNGQPNYGILLESTAEATHTEYMAREDSNNPPRLEVVVGSGSASPVAIQATGTLANGNSRTLSQPVARAYQPPGTVTLQLGTDPGADAMLDSFYEKNYGGRNYVQVNADPGWLQRPVFRFEMGRVPANSAVLSAQLELRMKAIVAPGTATVHRVTRSWVEGTQTGGGASDGASWDTYNGTNNWNSTGGDFNAAAVAEATIKATNTWVEWEIGPLVEQWLAGQPNNGLLLKADGALREVEFYSQEEADATLRPRLTITYACECGSPCMAPQGTGRIALIGDDNSPDPDDQLKIQIIESWGYEVDFYEDRESDTINWSDYDLAYVSETVITGDVSANLANLSIGVVNEEPRLYDDLQVASGDTEHVGSSLNITDNSHFITAIFQQGPLSIYTGDMEILTADSPLASGLQTLGEFGGAASLTALDKGAQTTSGTAAGRRVTLPLGQHSTAGFDWRHMDHSSHLIVQRAISWAAGTDVVSAGNLLMVVGNDGSLTSQEAAKKALIESWGWTVNVIDEDDNQSAFDTALAANDVVFVTEDVNAADINTKLTSATIGVVTEEANLSDELGVSDGIAWGSGTNIKVDNGYYITQPLPLGSNPVLTTTESLAYLTGTIAPDLNILGESADGRALASLDGGARMRDGGTTAGRRVFLPWGGNDMDVNHLNAEGLTIFQRALQWGAGACLSKKQLLFVVGDAANPSSRDIDWKAQIESWCYNVELIDDGESQADLVAAAASNDVVYVSGTSSYVALADKLADVDKPLLNEPMWLLNDFGFSEDEGYNTTFSGFLESDASHYITTPFGGGAITIFTENLLMGTLHGTMSPELQDLGGFAVTPILAALEFGGDRWDGTPAPARRVQVPFQDAAVSQLTVDGMIMLRRSLDWAAGADPYTGPLAHWKLDETSGVTAVDSVGGHDGTLINDPAWGSGAIGGGLVLDGSNEHFVVPHDDKLSFSSFTITAWTYSTDTSLINTIVHKTSESEMNYYLSRNYDEVICAFNNSPDDYAYTTGLDIATDQWYHIACTYDDSSSEIKIYVDGILLATDIATNDPLPNNGQLWIGRNSVTGYWDGTLDDIRLYNRALAPDEITAIAAVGGGGGGGGGASYVEKFNLFTIANADTWQPVDLSIPGVPANAVAEIAIMNSRTGNERWGGVRAYGSSLNRRFQLHEAEGGGVDAVVMHVQTNENSWIEAYSDVTSEVTFRLLGYWTGATYVERFDTFTAGGSNSWRSHNLGSYGVGANEVAEIVVANTSTSRERMAGVRPSGTSMVRRFNIHEAESGGVDTVSLMVGTDASATAEVYTSSDSDIDFYVVGHWSTPPGTYTEKGGSHSQITTSSAWHQWDLTSFGVPADSIVQIVMTNEGDTAEQEMGVRAMGSSHDRVLDIQEAESGGSDNASMHAIVDGNKTIEAYSESGATDRYFYPVGWWVLN